MHFKRLLGLKLPKGQSAFLWGARKTGKSTYLKRHYPDSIYYDLLKTDLSLRLSKAPHLLREEILALPKNKLAHPVIVDEIQKVPALLDEVHWLIENTDAYFILCGSSARKLKHLSTNLLGGRAWRFTMHPLVSAEINDFDLLQALNRGLIPAHYQQEMFKRSLKAYVEDYLTHEVQAEGLVRNLGDFARFMDVFAFSNGELTNYSNIARDCAVDAKTVKAYYQILEDTLVGYSIHPFHKKSKRDQIASTPKFYLFDVGLAQYLQKISLETLQGAQAGKSFEHWILMELMAYKSYHEKDFDITFWRTKTGLEVDFVLAGGNIAIESKISSTVRQADLRGLFAFCEEFSPKHAWVVSTAPAPRRLTTPDGHHIDILPWQVFIEKLWGGEII